MKKYFTVLLSFIVLPFYSLLAQAPMLNSHPGAAPTIYLDFDGQTVQTAYWNGGNAFYATPYTFTSDQINTMFKMVAEDFRPFQVNITTDSSVYFAAPINRRQRMIVTTNSSWYGNAGGVAYTGSFRWGLEIPAFVFSNLLGNNFKYVAEAISHEAGHTLGLQHQSSYDANCNFISEYNSGAGSGEIGWAPIMGVGYQRNLTLWHNGSSSLGCSSIQNDATLIASTSNGITYRNDDIGNTIQESVPLVLNGSNYNTSGLINSTNDIDVFSYALAQRGQFTLQAIPFNTGNNSTSANIDIKIDLLSSGGTLLRSINPAAQLAASLDTTLDAGNYFLRVSNVSNANVSNYGMLGSYALTGSFTGTNTGNTGDTNTIVQSITLSGQVRTNQHELWWNIVANEPIAYVSLQRSLDGISFIELFRSTSGATSYVYTPQETTLIYYKAVAATSTNKLITSNTISLRSKTKSSKTRLITNQVSNQIGWISDAPADWRLMDATGNIVLKGRFTVGTNYIAVSHLDAGIYFLQTIEDGALKTHKIMKY